MGHSFWVPLQQYPTYETDLSIRAEIQNLPMLPNNPKPGRVSELLLPWITGLED